MGFVEGVCWVDGELQDVIRLVGMVMILYRYHRVMRSKLWIV